MEKEEKKWTSDEIEEFIDNFKYYQHRVNVVNYRAKRMINIPAIIEDQFRNGFCYHFAMILQHVVGGGDIIYLFPQGHFVFEYEDEVYDARGKLTKEQIDAMYPLSCIYEKDLPKHIKELYLHKTLYDKDYHRKLEVKAMDEGIEYFEKVSHGTITRTFLKGIVKFESRDDESLKDYFKKHSKYYRNIKKYPKDLSKIKKKKGDKKK